MCEMVLGRMQLKRLERVFGASSPQSNRLTNAGGAEVGTAPKSVEIAQNMVETGQHVIKQRSIQPMQFRPMFCKLRARLAERRLDARAKPAARR